jgi:hypothetical protein
MEDLVEMPGEVITYSEEIGNYFTTPKNIIVEGDLPF